MFGKKGRTNSASEGRKGQLAKAQWAEFTVAGLTVGRGLSYLYLSTVS